MQVLEIEHDGFIHKFVQGELITMSREGLQLDGLIGVYLRTPTRPLAIKDQAQVALTLAKAAGALLQDSLATTVFPQGSIFTSQTPNSLTMDIGEQISYTAVIHPDASDNGRVRNCAIFRHSAGIILEWQALMALDFVWTYDDRGEMRQQQITLIPDFDSRGTRDDYRHAAVLVSRLISQQQMMAFLPTDCG